MLKINNFTIGFILLLSFNHLSFAQGTPDWAPYALKLSAESEAVTLYSIKKLKKFPRLEEKLKLALKANSTRKYLALDVISTLKLEALLPDLIADSKSDESGFFFLSLNTFFTPEHHAELLKLFQERLADQKSSTPVKMVLLDTLGRLNVKISEKELRHFLSQTQDPEVRSAALYYLRSVAVKKDLRYAKVLSDLIAAQEPLDNPSSFSAQLSSLQAEISKLGEPSP